MRPASFGKRCVRMQIPHELEAGLDRLAPRFAGETETHLPLRRLAKDARHPQRLGAAHDHYRNMAGEHCESQKFAATGPALSRTNDWTSLSGLFTMPDDIVTSSST